MEMIKNNQTATETFFKGKYMIVFYDENDEDIVISFNNIKEICKYRKLDVCQKNLTLISVEVYRALKREDHYTRILNGKLMHVYLIDTREIEEE